MIFVKRKVILQGGKTLMVSLPIKWAGQFNIQKGDELEYNTDGAVISFSAKGEAEVTKTTVNLEGMDERGARYVLSGLHKSGYDEITIYYDNHLKTIEDLIKNLYVGFAIVEQDKNKVVLRCISRELVSEFEAALRRAFLVTLSLGESMLEALKLNEFSRLGDLTTLEKTNNQLTNFCQRLLNKHPYLYPKKQNFIYTIIWNLEKVCDNYKYICNIDFKGTLDLKEIEALEKVQGLLRGYYELFYKFEIGQVSKLNIKKKGIEKELFLLPDSKLKFFLLNSIYQIVEFSASMTAFKHEAQ